MERDSEGGNEGVLLAGAGLEHNIRTPMVAVGTVQRQLLQLASSNHV